MPQAAVAVPAWHALLESRHPVQVVACWHWPSALHTCGGQDWHACPLVPQALSCVPSWQVPLESQQPLQLDGPQPPVPCEQVPPEQLCPGKQVWQVAP